MKLSRGVLVTGIVVSGIVAAFIFGIVIPGERHRGEQRRSIRDAQAALRTEQEEVKQQTAVYGEVNQLAERLREFDKIIPTRHEFAETYRALSTMVSESGLKRLVIQPGRAQPLGAADIPGKLTLAREIMVQPVTLEAEGTMQAAAKLLKSLEDWRRLNRIERLELHRVNLAPAAWVDQVAEPIIHCEIILHTFYLPHRESGQVVVALSRDPISERVEP